MKPLNVLYKKVDGAHFFVSADKKVGLCIAHSNLKTAYDAVSVELTKLHKANFAEDVKFVPATDFTAFEAWVQKVETVDADHAQMFGGVPAWQQMVMAAE